jgi:hypothetical protein
MFVSGPRQSRVVPAALSLSWTYLRRYSMELALFFKLSVSSAVSSLSPILPKDEDS